MDAQSEVWSALVSGCETKYIMQQIGAQLWQTAQATGEQQQQ